MSLARITAFDVAGHMPGSRLDTWTIIVTGDSSMKIIICHLAARAAMVYALPVW